jgi:DNA-directed RNA polymerase subunit M/transcription elongation factor TFIIS
MTSVVDWNEYNIRGVVKNKLSVYIPDKTIVDSIELELYRATFKYADNKGIFKHWSNVQFTQFYSDRIHTILKNIDPNAETVKNPTLLDSIITGKVTPQELINMTPEQMNPTHWEMVIAEQNAKEIETTAFKQNTTDHYECDKCHKRECIYNTAQIRSADEASTIFLECINCHNKWSIND